MDSVLPATRCMGMFVASEHGERPADLLAHAVGIAHTNRAPSTAALMKSANNGCGAKGLLFNSG